MFTEEGRFKQDFGCLFEGALPEWARVDTIDAMSRD